MGKYTVVILLPFVTNSLKVDIITVFVMSPLNLFSMFKS